MKDIEIKEYIGEKFDKLEKKTRWWTVLFITLAVALMGSGFMAARAVGNLESRTEAIYKEYVPADLLLVIMYSYDFQNEYFLSLMNGDKEGAEKKFREFVIFRRDMYEQHFKTRGSVSPVEGRTLTK